MSTQQILGVVGGVVGAFFGYPQLGFVVGSLVGGLLTPGEKTEGPRVDDLKVQVSTYGVGIPLMYGTERVGGNVVWSTDKIEVEETTGGKGGGPENTTYRYYVHMGVVLCDTPRDGSTVSIVQIFKDGKLIYDARSGIPIGSALASAENPHAYFVLYQGHADQLPDPGEEAWMGGPGSVPAYRGVVRIRMNAIECPGGRVPQFSFVLSTNASTAPTGQVIVDFSSPSYNVIAGLAKSDGSVWNIGQFTNGGVITLFVSYGASTGEQRITNQLRFTGTDLTYYPMPAIGAEEPIAVYLSGAGSGFVNLLNLETMVRVGLYSPETSSDFLPGMSGNHVEFMRAACDPTTGNYAIAFQDADVTPAECPPLIFENGEVLSCDPISGVTAGIAFYDDVLYVLKAESNQWKIASRSAVDGTEVHAEVAGAGPVGSANIQKSGLYASASGLYALIFPAGSSGLDVYKIDTTTMAWSLIAEQVPVGLDNFGHFQRAFYASDDVVVVGPTVNGEYSVGFLRPLTVADVKVSDIIADQCDRAGESRYDVSGIPDTDTLHGYKLQNPASARSNIDPLLTAFAIYIVDEDGLIKFKKYEDIVSEATVTYDELGQAEDGAEPADAMPLNRAQEIDMPRSVSVSYIEPTFDYQTASEKEVRQITEATEDMIIELPMATTSDHAKQVASMILFAKWRAQNTRSFKTSRKFAFLSPGDGVTVEYPRGTFRLWRITSMTDTGALCEFNVEPGDAELYTQTAVGATGYVQQEVAPLASPTRLQLLDIPILRDEDNNAGIYAALDNYADGWTGAELLVGYDDTSLVSRGTVSTDAPIGFAETVLGNASSGFVDESNIFTVSIGNNDFESVTRDVLLANGAEFWAYGVPGRWEIGASAVGDSLGGGRYILSRHLRGQFGTEANAALHEEGDVFVLLRIAGMLRPSTGAGDIGQAQNYRAVSKGRSRDSVASQTYTNTGEGLMPLSPVNLRRSNTNDLSVDRRSRLAMNNSTGALPLGEATEAWAWDFYTSSGFTTLIGSALTTTATVTAAQITSAGATPSGALYVRVSQLGDSIGRGHELQATI